MAWVYILQEQDGGRYYIGSTINLKRRLQQHLSGQTPTTHRFVKLALVFSQEYETIKIARRVEQRLKKLKRRDYIQKIVNDGCIRIGV